MKLNNREKSAFAAIIGLALVTYCHADETKKPVSPKIGTVIVYRQPMPLSGMYKYPFNLDHGVSHKLKNGCFEKFELPAGQHIISHDHLPLRGQDAQIVQVEAGKTIYFQYSLIGWGAFTFEVADDQVSAAQTARNCRPN
jgi:hypothetical protein